jgi:perosamine synthetase
MARLQKQAETRDQNASHLTKLLSEIRGIQPERRHEGCTRSSNHLYMFRFQKEHFAGLSRAKFLEALGKEGIPASGGYGPLNTDEYVKSLASNPHYQRIYGKETMAKWQERNVCPVNDRLCSEAVWFTQTMLLGPKSDMERIAEGVRRIQAYAGEIARL